MKGWFSGMRVAVKGEALEISDLNGRIVYLSVAEVSELAIRIPEQLRCLHTIRKERFLKERSNIDKQLAEAEAALQTS